jgi:hypothetical protein
VAARCREDDRRETRRNFSFLSWVRHHDVPRSRYLEWPEWEQAYRWFVGVDPSEPELDVDEAYEQAMQTYREAFGVEG